MGAPVEDDELLVWMRNELKKEGDPNEFPPDVLANLTVESGAEAIYELRDKKKMRNTLKYLNKFTGQDGERKLANLSFEQLKKEVEELKRDRSTARPGDPGDGENRGGGVGARLEPE